MKPFIRQQDCTISCALPFYNKSLIQHEYRIQLWVYPADLPITGWKWVPPIGRPSICNTYKRWSGIITPQRWFYRRLGDPPAPDWRWIVDIEINVMMPLPIFPNRPLVHTHIILGTGSSIPMWMAAMESNTGNCKWTDNKKQREHHQTTTWEEYLGKPFHKSWFYYPFYSQV